MSNTNKGAAAAKALPPSNSVKPAAEPTMEVVKTPIQVPVNEVLQKKLVALNSLNMLNGKREKLLAKRAEVHEFELDMDGESDEITLEAAEGASVVIKRPEAIKTVLGFLKEELNAAITKNEQELLAVVA